MSLSDGSSAGGYSRADRLLHRIAMTGAVLDLSFDIERSRFGAAARAQAGGAPVFVAGLARAGTTIILRVLHETGAFASLTYRDMPFPLAPNSWHRMTARSRHDIASAARGHGDGLEHDLDSPEAIEEAFWRIRPGVPVAETIAEFRDLVALVRLRYAKPRYLSKNNANTLRLPAIVEAFPDAVLLHPFRDPAEQAASLLGQHVRAIELGRADPFRARYMRWLGHHDFGLDHRPPDLPGAPSAGEPSDGVDYWLRIWIAVHRHLLDQPGDVRARQLFVDYDALCADPAAGLAPIAAAVGVPLAGGTLRVTPRRDTLGADPALLDDARAVHAALISRRTSPARP